MKEQDYMNIMGSIRGEYLEEAVAWDGAQRRRIRQIRRMTVSFGAVAAALAVVVGMIAYRANKDKIDTANSDKDSSVTEDLEKQRNLYGGHGELHQIRGMNGIICYDDDYVYEWSEKWSVRSGGKTIRMQDDEVPENLFKDGENLFRLHDGKIFETDSFGKETELIDIAAWQFPLTVEADRIHSVQKLSERLLCIGYDNNAQYEALLICDLQTKTAVQQYDPTFCTLFPDSETSYYAFSSMAGRLAKYELNADGSLTDTAVWDAGQVHYEYNAVVLKDQKLYLAVKQYQIGEADPATVPERWMVADLNSGKLEDAEVSMNDRLYAGTAKIRMTTDADSFQVYRSTLDGRDEKQIFSVPFDQYFDTAAYGTPELPGYQSVYESDDMVIVYLPVTVNGAEKPAKHGEQAVMIDLHTGKALYYGEEYSLSTPDDSSIAEAISTTAVGGTGSINAENGTTVSGTTLNGTTVSGTVTTASKTNAAGFTVAEGSNIFGGSGYLYPQIGRFCTDGSGDLYEVMYNGTRLRPYSDQSVMYVDAGTVCRKENCKHDDESCPLYHYNLNNARMNADGTPKDGVTVRLLDGSHVQRGTKVYTIDERTGAETQLFEIRQVNGSSFGDADLWINSITKIGSADASAERYIVNASLSLGVAGVNPDCTYVLLVDAKRSTIKLIGQPGPEGIDENNIAWSFIKQDYQDALYVLQGQDTLIRVDAVTGTMTSYPLGSGQEAQAHSAWCVRDNKMWFLDRNSRWLCYDLSTKQTTVIKENVPLQSAYDHCLNIGNDMFVGIRDSEDGYSRTLIFFRYDWKNSTEQHISDITPLTELEGAVSYMGNYLVLFHAQDGLGLCYEAIPDWAP
ncbi:MAG: hypothetical protein J5753_05280 [Oscillospiraceae bacterium]|nr:hypothetical protein [Oscillospiraceae bacterium]